MTGASDPATVAERLLAKALARAEPDWRFAVWAFFHPFKFGEYHGRLTTLAEVSSELRALATLRTDGEANSRAVPSGEAVERVWPDIGVEPLTLPRPRDIEETKARLNAAAVRQQPHVPNGTALVWRTDLLDTKHRLIRMEALAENRKEQIATLSASKSDDASALLKEARLYVFNETLNTRKDWSFKSHALLAHIDEYLAKLDAGIGRDGA